MWFVSRDISNTMLFTYILPQVFYHSSHAFVCQRYRFCLFLRFFYWILELFRHCDIFLFFILCKMEFYSEKEFIHTWSITCVHFLEINLRPSSTYFLKISSKYSLVSSFILFDQLSNHVCTNGIHFTSSGSTNTMPHL